MLVERCLACEAEPVGISCDYSLKDKDDREEEDQNKEPSILNEPCGIQPSALRLPTAIGLALVLHSFSDGGSKTALHGPGRRRRDLGVDPEATVLLQGFALKFPKS